MQKKSLVAKVVAQLAYGAAERTVNETCRYLHYQPHVPNSVKKLKKHD